MGCVAAASVPAWALGAAALIMLPILGQSIAQLLESRRNEALQARLASAQISFQWAALQMQVGNVEAAHVSYRGALLSLGAVSNNADGYGTLLAVEQGRVFLERDGVGGYLNPDEVRLLGGLADQGRPLPIPVDPGSYPNRLDRSTSHALAERAARQLGLGAEPFMAQESIGGLRRFASGREVRLGGDSAVLLTVNRQPSTVAEGRTGRRVNAYPV